MGGHQGRSSFHKRREGTLAGVPFVQSVFEPSLAEQVSSRAENRVLAAEGRVLFRCCCPW